MAVDEEQVEPVEPDPTPETAPVDSTPEPSGLVRLYLPEHQEMEYPETAYPKVTHAGVLVSRDDADAMLTIAMKMGVTIREGV